MDDVAEVLQEVFGHSAFRPGQERAVRAFLDEADVQVLLPTGGGKSLCYQLSAIVRRRRGLGPTLVVSPLIALMEDQVRSLRERGVSAEALHSGMPWAEQRVALERAREATLIYASPERLAVKRFRRSLSGLGVSAAAVDEAHCISEWGHDFRPRYRELAVLKTELEVPVIAVTATATRRVMGDIRASLGLVDPEVIVGSFARPNLRFEVELAHTRGRPARIVELLTEMQLGKRRSVGRAVVYASSRKRVRSLRNTLAKAGFDAGWYHAGRTALARSRAQAAFVEGRHAVLVATTAFGMGVDLPDIRLVVHAQAPTTLEAWYQQAGRAGRDGASARCVLLWSAGDAVVRRKLVGTTPSEGAEAGWRALERLAEGTTCRQCAVSDYFLGVTGEPCGVCDACVAPGALIEALTEARRRATQRRDGRVAARRAADRVVLDDRQQDQIVSFVSHLKKPVGKGVIALGLRGSRSRRSLRAKLPENPLFGGLSGVPERAIVRAVEQLLDEGRLAPRGKKYPTVWMPGKRVRPKRTAKPSRPPPPSLARALAHLRKREARRRRWRAYQVFDNATLDRLVEARPATVDALREIKGMGPRRIAAFGEAILRLVRDDGDDVVGG